MNILKNAMRSAADFFLEIDKLDSKTHMDLKGTQNRQHDLKKEEQRRRTHTSCFQNLPQSNSN